MGLLVGCGTVKVVSEPGGHFAKGMGITVIGPSDDSLGIAGELEHLLSRGFKVVSETAASSVEYEEQLEEVVEGNSSRTVTRQREAGVARQFPSRLVLRFTYRGYWDLFYWAFTRFSATVVDAESGDVVASAQFSGDRRVGDVLGEFVSQLVVE